jgi:hypothetical protein
MLARRCGAFGTFGAFGTSGTSGTSGTNSALGRYRQAASRRGVAAVFEPVADRVGYARAGPVSAASGAPPD